VQSLGVTGARQALGRRDVRRRARRACLRPSTIRRSSSPRPDDRFRCWFHLEPSDISEVTSQAVLAKNATRSSSSATCRAATRPARQPTKLSADITLPELSRAAFIDLYPLLPYQIDLIIQVVSGLRTQGGASKHVGGANRTIIKLAQQLLIHPTSVYAQRGVGDLARWIKSTTSSRRTSTARSGQDPTASPSRSASHSRQRRQVDLPAAVRQSVHRTAENIAACLYPSLARRRSSSRSRKRCRCSSTAIWSARATTVIAFPPRPRTTGIGFATALRLDRAMPKRLHSRNAHRASGSRSRRITLEGVKPFRAGSAIDGHEEEKGDLTVHLSSWLMRATPSRAGEGAAAHEASRRPTRSSGPCPQRPIDRENVRTVPQPRYGSSQRAATPAPRTRRALADGRSRARRHQSRAAAPAALRCLNGSAYFRGNDRSPSSSAGDVAKATTHASSARFYPRVHSLRRRCAPDRRANAAWTA
jgi:hypothetical protein